MRVQERFEALRGDLLGRVSAEVKALDERFLKGVAALDTNVSALDAKLQSGFDRMDGQSNEVGSKVGKQMQVRERGRLSSVGLSVGGVG
jgi:hypothetical protein